jgi:hypothetical protein
MALSNQPNHPITTKREHLMLTKNFHQPYDTRFIGYLAKQKDSPEFIESEYGINVIY